MLRQEESILQKNRGLNSIACLGKFLIGICIIIIIIYGWPVCGSSEEATDSFPRLGIKIDSFTTITEVENGSVGRQAGLNVGDHIVSIEGQPTLKLNRSQKIRLLQGSSGTICHLVISRSANLFSVVINRKLTSELGKIKSPILQNVSISDREFVRVEQHTEQMDSSLTQIYQGLALVPESVKNQLRAAGVYIMLVPQIAAFDNKEGGAYFSPKLKCVVIHRPPDGRVPRGQITTLHELGHAYDYVLGYPSRQSKFLELYRREASSCQTQYRKDLEYFLRPGNLGARECFASLFARKYYKATDKRLETLEKVFPETFRYVQQLK